MEIVLNILGAVVALGFILLILLVIGVCFVVSKLENCEEDDGQN